MSSYRVFFFLLTRRKAYPHEPSSLAKTEHDTPFPHPASTPQSRERHRFPQPAGETERPATVSPSPSCGTSLGRATVPDITRFGRRQRLDLSPPPRLQLLPYMSFCYGPAETLLPRAPTVLLSGSLSRGGIRRHWRVRAGQ